MLLVLEKPFRHLEERRIQLFQQLETYTQEQVFFQPSPQAWSIVEVLHHLLLAEEGTYQYIEKKLKEISALRRVTLGAKLKSKVLKLALKSPLKFKVPLPALVPSREFSLEQLRENWGVLRQRLQAILEALTEADLEKALFRHPIGGVFTMQQTFSFLQEHFEHHDKQIKRIQADANFPAKKA
jgi:hypothetical protein